MTENENSVVDPSIVFGGNAVPMAQPQPMTDAGAIPDFLDRSKEQPEAETVQPQPVFTTAVNEATGQTEVTVEGSEALVSNAPSEVEKAAHSPAVEGNLAHDNSTNQPPEEESPQTREEMLKEMWKDFTAYGKASGAGAAALPRLGLRVVRAAADGLISNEKPKDGSKSDAVRIYEKYAEQDSKHSEHSKGGMKANAAKLNALIGLGCMTTVDGVEIADRTVKLREKMEAEEAKPKALFAGLVDVARAQAEEDQPLTDDAIMAALGKTVKDKTVAEEWTAIYKKIEKLVSGENPQGIRDDSDKAQAIASQVSEHINNFAQSAEIEDQVAFCMDRGMTRADALTFVQNRQ